MNRLWRNMLEKNVKPMNRTILRGWSYHRMQYALEYINAIMKIASESFPENLKYEGLKRCTPEEQFCREVSTGKTEYEISHSDLYCIEFMFKYYTDNNSEGIPIIRHVYMPFIREGNLIYLNGSLNGAIPILNDKIISATKKEIYVALSSNKIKYESKTYQIIIDGCNRSVDLIHGILYSYQSEFKGSYPRIKAKTTLIHYLYGMYGLSGTWNTYLGFTPIILKDKPCPNEYPSSKYIIATTKGVKPTTLYIRDTYVPHTLHILIDRDKVNDSNRNIVYDILGTTIYIFDHFTDKAVSHTIADDVNDIRLWRIMLGTIIFNNMFSINSLVSRMNDHYDSLGNYIDTFTRKKLRSNGFNVTTFYDLLFEIACNFTSMINQSFREQNNLLRKEVTVISEILYPIRRAIFKMMFEIIKKTGEKKDKNFKDINIKSIEKIINRELTPRCIFKLQDANHSRNNVHVLDYVGDNMFFAITSNVKPQNQGSGFKQSNGSKGSGGGRNKVALGDAIYKLHASIAEVGTYLTPIKKHPVGNGRINPYVTIDEDENIIPNIELQPYIDMTQKLITEPSIRYSDMETFLDDEEYGEYDDID